MFKPHNYNDTIISPIETVENNLITNNTSDSTINIETYPMSDTNYNFVYVRTIDDTEYNRLKTIEKKYMEVFGNGESKEIDILTNDRSIDIK